MKSNDKIELGYRMSKVVKIGNISIGGGNPIAIQSMTNTDTKDVKSTLNQIEKLYQAGCDIVRCSVPNEESAKAIKEIAKNSPIPVVADIHFDYRLAIKSVENGVAKVRINPGNIGSSDKVKDLAKCLIEHNVPARIGVNGGSLDIKHQSADLSRGMAESAIEHCEIFENAGFEDIVLSVKCSNVKENVKAYRLLKEMRNYPLHLGVTEAGLLTQGTVKNAIGIGSLLIDDIGDTIRVSLTDDPVKEVLVAKDILKAVDKYNKPFTEVTSCPTCARTMVDVKSWASEIEDFTKDAGVNLRIAVMGCIVNGIGESKGCDIGIVGGKDKSILLLHGNQVGVYDNNEILPKAKELISNIIAQYKK